MDDENNFKLDDIKKDFKLENEKYNGKSSEDKSREQNRIRQLAYKVRERMPKDYDTFMRVATHLVKNAHRYHSKESAMKNFDGQMDGNSQVKSEDHPKEETEIELVQINKALREIQTLRRQNRIREQQEKVCKLKQQYGTYRQLTAAARIPLKTIHSWCAEPK